MLRKALPAVVLLAGIAVIIAAQFSIPTLFGADGYLHIRMAEFLRDLGPRYDFHWTRYSIFAERFADKDFLYHAAMIPFTFFDDIFFGAKLAACCGALGLFAGFIVILRRYCTTGLLCGLGVVFFLSSSFLQAISRPRPMVVVMLLSLLFIHNLIRRRHLALFGISLAYALMHVSGPLLLVFALMGEGVRFAAEGTFDRKTLLFVTLGVAAGFLGHPNFPHNVLVFYLNGILVPLFAFKWGLELGAEFFPLDMRSFALAYPWVLIGFLVFAVAAVSRGNKISTATRGWMAFAGSFFILSFFSRRYAAHCYPVFLTALGAYITDWWAGGRRLALVQRKVILRYICVILLVAALGLSARSTFRRFQEVRQAERAYNGHYEYVGRWIRDHVPPGETIFHANWSDSQFFIGLSPEHDYFVTLDPIYLYYWNKELYHLYREVAFGRNPDPYTVLREVFDVRYGYAGADYFSGLIRQVKSDPRFEVMAENRRGVFFRLKG